MQKRCRTFILWSLPPSLTTSSCLSTHLWTGMEELHGYWWIWFSWERAFHLSSLKWAIVMSITRRSKWQIREMWGLLFALLHGVQSVCWMHIYGWLLMVTQWENLMMAGKLSLAVIDDWLPLDIQRERSYIYSIILSIIVIFSFIDIYFLLLIQVYYFRC